MGRSPDGRGPRPGGDGRSPLDFIAVDNSDGSDLSLDLCPSQLRPRPIGSGELASLRALWWRQAALGHRLPAEIGVIVLEGGGHDSICG